MTVVPKHAHTHLGTVRFQLSLHTCAVRVYKIAYIPFPHEPPSLTFSVAPNPLLCKTWLYCSVCSAQTVCMNVSRGPRPWLLKSKEQENEAKNADQGHALE